LHVGLTIIILTLGVYTKSIGDANFADFFVFGPIATTT
jgi:hypothetical protein